jgi:hypothetical protein
LDQAVAPRAASIPISFVAKITGRFPVEAHRMDPAAKGTRHAGTLFYVEVYPP